jgi:quercetin dioxygenase-like cupin family protein
MTATTRSEPYLLAPEDGRAIWHLGALMRFVATGEDTGGRFWLAEQLSDQGYASPPHRHTHEDELFFVLDGALRVQVGDNEHEVRPSGTVFAPRGLPHSFRVESKQARFLIFTAPAGFERWFFETGTPASTLTLPPPGAVPPPDIGRVIGALRDYGVEPLGPPPD